MKLYVIGSLMLKILYVIGTAAGPHPYPMMVRDFQSVIGIEAMKQILKFEKKLPNFLMHALEEGPTL